MTLRRCQILLVAFAMAMLFSNVLASFQAPFSGPPIYVAERNGAKVYILGIASASGSKWLTPTIKSALMESKELWQEDPTEQAFNQSWWEELGYRKHGTLFDDLGAEMANRVRRTAQIYGVKEEELARQRAWFSALTLVRAWLGKAGMTLGQTGNPEGVISELAAINHIPIHSEMNSDDFLDEILEAVDFCRRALDDGL